MPVFAVTNAYHSYHLPSYPPCIPGVSLLGVGSAQVLCFWQSTSPLVCCCYIVLPCSLSWSFVSSRHTRLELARARLLRRPLEGLLPQQQPGDNFFFVLFTCQKCPVSVMKASRLLLPVGRLGQQPSNSARLLAGSPAVHLWSPGHSKASWALGYQPLQSYYCCHPFLASVTC